MQMGGMEESFQHRRSDRLTRVFLAETGHHLWRPFHVCLRRATATRGLRHNTHPLQGRGEGEAAEDGQWDGAFLERKRVEPGITKGERLQGCNQGGVSWRVPPGGLCFLCSTEGRGLQLPLGHTRQRLLLSPTQSPSAEA